MNKTEKQEFLQKYGNRARAELKKVKTEIKIFKACLKRAELHKPEALGGIKWLLDAGGVRPGDVCVRFLCFL